MNISVSYLGLRLSTPIVIGACPLTANLESARQLECSGAGAIVLPSIFEEQIARDSQSSGQFISKAEEVASDVGYRPSHDTYNGGTTEYLQTIEMLKQNAAIPVIASLNGWTSGNWLKYAVEIEKAGADALELNLHDYSDSDLNSSDAIEDRLATIVSEVCDLLSIPVSVKIQPFFTCLPNLAWKLAGAGARGLVLFGHEPELMVHLDSMTINTSWQLTPPGAIGLTLAGLTRIQPARSALSLVASGGIASSSDVLKTLLAGADVAMVTSVVYREGADVIRLLIDGIVSYLQHKRIDSLAGLLECRIKSIEKHADLHRRLGYTTPLTTFSNPKRDINPSSIVQSDRWGHPVPKYENGKGE